MISVANVIIIFLYSSQSCIFFPYIHTKKRPAARAVGRFVFLMESSVLNFGCHFDNQLYLIPGAVQDDVDNGIDVSNVDFTVTVHVGSR